MTVRNGMISFNSNFTGKERVVELLNDIQCLKYALNAVEKTSFDDFTENRISSVKEYLKTGRFGGFNWKESYLYYPSNYLLTAISYHRKLSHSHFEYCIESCVYWSSRVSTDENSAMKNYIEFAKIFTMEDEEYNKLTHLHSVVKQFDFENIVDINIFFDFLSDYYPENNLVNKLAEAGIEGKDRQELIENISKSGYAITLMEHVFKNLGI